VNRHVFIKCAKIAGGSALAIFLAGALGLEYATSAGIITLLTLQNTRRATLRLSLFRVFSFAVTMLFAGVLCTLLGFRAAAYGLVMLLVTMVSFPLGWGDTISTNAVFCTHLFMMGQALTPQFVFNEFLLLVIGTGIAILLNWRMPDKEREVRATLEFTERELKEIMGDISAQILSPQTSAVQARIDALAKRMEKAKEASMENMDNTLQAHSEFYLNYFEFRLQQCAILTNFCHSVMSLRVVPDQAKPISRALRIISENFGLHTHVEPRIEMMKDLLAYYQRQPLPADRGEFEARALLFYGLKELEEFLQLKQDFMERLTQEQKRLYLNLQRDGNIVE